jgi:hypothetical protein
MLSNCATIILRTYIASVLPLSRLLHPISSARTLCTFQGFRLTQQELKAANEQ